MTPLLAVALALAGGLGATLRHLVDLALGRLGASPLLPTLLVNVLGSFALGLLATHGSAESRLVWGAGFCGGFTTFSTAVLQSVRLGRPTTATALARAGLHALGMLVLCVLAALAGARIG